MADDRDQKRDDELNEAMPDWMADNGWSVDDAGLLRLPSFSGTIADNLATLTTSAHGDPIELTTHEVVSASAFLCVPGRA